MFVRSTASKCTSHTKSGASMCRSVFSQKAPLLSQNGCIAVYGLYELGFFQLAMEETAYFHLATSDWWNSFVSFQCGGNQG